MLQAEDAGIQIKPRCQHHISAVTDHLLMSQPHPGFVDVAGRCPDYIQTSQYQQSDGYRSHYLDTSIPMLLERP